MLKYFKYSYHLELISELLSFNAIFINLLSIWRKYDMNKKVKFNIKNLDFYLKT